jgi:hypothetical protein
MYHKKRECSPAPKVAALLCRTEVSGRSANDTYSRYTSVELFVKKQIFSFISTDIEVGTPLMNGGFDSIAIVEFSRLVGGCISSTVPATLLFDYPTSEAIVNFILKCGLSTPDTKIYPKTFLDPKIYQHETLSTPLSVPSHICAASIVLPGSVTKDTTLLEAVTKAYLTQS